VLENTRELYRRGQTRACGPAHVLDIGAERERRWGRRRPPPRRAASCSPTRSTADHPGPRPVPRAPGGQKLPQSRRPRSMTVRPIRSGNWGAHRRPLRRGHPNPCTAAGARRPCRLQRKTGIVGRCFCVTGLTSHPWAEAFNDKILAGGKAERYADGGGRRSPRLLEGASPTAVGGGLATVAVDARQQLRPLLSGPASMWSIPTSRRSSWSAPYQGDTSGCMRNRVRPAGVCGTAAALSQMAQVVDDVHAFSRPHRLRQAARRGEDRERPVFDAKWRP